jgi:hypothetical protein
MMFKDDETLVVLKPPRATIDVVEVAKQNHWRHIQRILPGNRRFYEEIYQVTASNTVVRVIDDAAVQIIFVALQGEGRKEVESKLRREIETLDEAAILALLDSKNPKDRATGLRILGAVAPDRADMKTVAAFAKAAKDGAPGVFKALIAAVGRAAWPELWPIVDELAKSKEPEAKELKSAYEAHIPRSS